MATKLLKIEELLNGGNVQRNLTVSELVEESVRNSEGVLTKDGALSVSTGKFTGRSPKDKFIVKDEVSNHVVDWGNINQPIDAMYFDALLEKVVAHLEQKERLYYLEAAAGADSHYKLPVRVLTEYAWHNLFAKQLFLREWPEQAAFEPFTVIYAPSYQADPEIDGTNSETFIIVSLAKRTILIGGTEYGGEIKKSIFSIMNFLLPESGVLSMHCSANVSDNGESALFFGLSGTGKTTLSADPNRHLIGDDEHGWSDEGIFNIEGGCYAKTINLSRENEPEIYDAIRFGTIIENVILRDDRSADYADTSLTENTRAAYPIDYIHNAKLPSKAGHPNTIIFLTADAYGVLPPISKLTKEQAMYHFLSGYTSKLAGTERGITEPQATFSTCFGSPFLPLAPERYADMLGALIDRHQVEVYLVNTGWTGGPYGEGSRMKLSYTRAMVNAAIEGKLRNVETFKHDIFNVNIPVAIEGVPADVLNPRQTWTDTARYDEQANMLARKFQENFKRFTQVEEAVLMAGPTIV